MRFYFDFPHHISICPQDEGYVPNIIGNFRIGRKQTKTRSTRVRSTGLAMALSYEVSCGSCPGSLARVSRVPTDAPESSWKPPFDSKYLSHKPH